jgi:hypothetical protein
VTPEDHAVLHRLLESSARIEGKVEAIYERINMQDLRLNGHSKKIGEHEAVLNQAKGARTVLFGIAGILSAAMGWLASKMERLF